MVTQTIMQRRVKFCARFSTCRLNLDCFYLWDKNKEMNQDLLTCWSRFIKNIAYEKNEGKLSETPHLDNLYLNTPHNISFILLFCTWCFIILHHMTEPVSHLSSFAHEDGHLNGVSFIYQSFDFPYFITPHNSENQFQFNHRFEPHF